MYIQIYEFMYMDVHATFNLFIIMYMYIQCIYMYMNVCYMKTCTDMSVPCSATYVPFYPFLSRWSGFQMRRVETRRLRKADRT